MANEALKPLSLSNYPLDEVTLESAKNLVESITSGDSDRALDAIARLASLHESALFQELGKLTREFHEALNTFSHDDRIAELAEDDIPDAKVRLSYVIEKTDEAAHRTLSAVENSIPIC
ncbi:MAG: protein phosphatase CheZ, partial [Gammaproteobacteria bacterium]|nr:protein phosphatase CheZ [Gammaproteobacteria bacterium]